MQNDVGAKHAAESAIALAGIGKALLCLLRLLHLLTLGNGRKVSPTAHPTSVAAADGGGHFEDVIARLVTEAHARIARTLAEVVAEAFKSGARAQAALSRTGARPKANAALGPMAFDARTLRRRDASSTKLARASGASAATYSDLRAQGEAARVEWTKNGSLVSSTGLAQAWGISRQGLVEAVARHELFLLKISGRLWAPAVFEELSRDAVKAVCSTMSAADPESQFFFWARPHGALGRKTAAQAIQAGRLARVVEVAQGLAEENGWSRAQPAA